MAILKRQDLRDYWNANLNTNATNAITGQKLNVGGIDIIDSVIVNSEPEPYQWFDDTDPETIGNPPAGNYYQGILDARRWVKESDGTIIFSSSGALTILDITANDFAPQEDYLQKLVRWTGTANGTITLSTEDLPWVYAGYRFQVFNDTNEYSILVSPNIISGTDVVKSHNNFLYIPAQSYATIGILKVEPGLTEWYATIEQTSETGIGAVANDQAAIAVAATAGVWTEVGFQGTVYADLVNIEAGTSAGRLRINYPNQGTNSVAVNVTVHASMTVPDADQVLSLSIGVDGAAIPTANVYQIAAKAGGVQTADLQWPFTFSYSGFVPNGSEISAFINYSATNTIDITTMNLQLKTDAIAGVSIDPS